MTRSPLKLAAAGAFVALLAVSCTSNDDGGDNASSDATTTTVHGDDHSSTTMGGASSGSVTQTGAAELRAGLTSLLQEHVYLAGAAISQAVQAGGDMEDPAVVSATDTLDANSVALSDAIASVYGEDAGAQFLELWRNHIGFFVDYTLGGATGDTAAQDEAKQKLDDYRADFGAFVESATGGSLDAGTVAEELQVHVDSLVTAVDDILAGSPDVYPDLREAAQHMPGTAAALAGAIAEQNPDQFS